METPPRKDVNISHTRHGEANYDAYREILRSDNPEAGFDPKKQPESDLTDNGKEKAKEAAKVYLDGLDLEKAELFFVASNETRAIETANIYRQEAIARGFQIITPDNVRNANAEKIGEGDIRVIDTISINYNNALENAIFAGPKQFEGLEINWTAVSPEVKEKFFKAREIVLADDGGSWGANFFKHSEKIKEIFPDIVTAQEEYERKFKNLIRLTEFGARKVQESGREVKVMIFGHENYMSVALNKYFGNHEIKNLETVNFTVGEDGVELEKGGSHVRIE